MGEVRPGDRVFWLFGISCLIGLAILVTGCSRDGVFVTGTSASTAPVKPHDTTATPASTPTRIPSLAVASTQTSFERPTITAIPTHQPTERPLSAQLGFTDEYINELQENGAQFLEISETITDGIRYALIFFWDGGETILLAYNFEDSNPILLLDSRVDDLPGKWAVGAISRMDAEEWGDLNQDGRPDLVVFYGYAGTAWGVRSQVHVWQIESREEIIDLTAPIYEDYRLIPQYAIEDLNDDGILDLWVGDYRGELYGPGHLIGVSSFKIYAWQNDQVYDISDQFLDLYDERIAKYRERVENTYGAEMDERIAEEILTQAFGLLIDYENSGRRSMGWQVYWELTNPEHWSYSSIDVSEILKTRRELHQTQYESGEPFGR